MNEHILLVLGISEGHRFSKRPHHMLLVEANFNGEVLSTDHTKHISNPHFNTELAWEINKKSLHQHRLQRTPIKVQVFALQTTTMKKELVGYFILDLRTAQQEDKKRASWQALLSPKYQHMKPEVKITLSVEPDRNKIEKEKEASALEEKENISTGEPEQNNNVEVVLDNDQGYYIMGPECAACEVFVLSVSIGGAQNLVQVLPSNAEINSESGFYFYYSLFDNDVTNETFHDLVSPSMPTERASVRIFTTQKRLEAYLRKKRTLEVYLCCSENTLAQAVISLLPLISNESFEKPSAVSGFFKLASSATTTSSDALVGVSVVLRKEQQGIVTDDMSPIRPGRERAKSPPVMPPPVPKLPTPTKSPKATKTKVREQPPGHQSTLSKDHQLQPPGHQSTISKNHHYIYSIDIRSIANMNIRHPVNCVCRYTYPFFGSSSPVITNPPVYIQKNSEVLLPQSFCKFEFASTTELLHSTLTRVALIIEVWHKDANTVDQLLGVSQVNLSDVFQVVEKNLDGAIVKSERLPIISAENPGETVGRLHIVLGFQDRGVIGHKMAATKEQSFTDSNVTTAPISSADPIDSPRGTQEYQVAMALELWREQQEDYFRSQLASKENERMKRLAEEWKERDQEREAILKRKLDEYNILEVKLKKTLGELEEREKQVNEIETNLERSKILLAEEYERKSVELREASRRLKEEYEHQVQLERRRYADLEERVKAREQHVTMLEIKVGEREKEIYSLKESLLNRPEVKMQSDLNLLLLEKGELERKIETVTKSKIHYKQQWGRALRELARIKVNEQEAAQTRLKKQQQELDHMKLRYLAVEEREVIKNEKEELDDVKAEINQRLQQLQVAMSTTQQQNQEHMGDEDICSGKTRISKLIEERDTLLQTGVYTINDRVIEEIEKEIQNLITVNNK